MNSVDGLECFRKSRATSVTLYLCFCMKHILDIASILSDIGFSQRRRRRFCLARGLFDRSRLRRNAEGYSPEAMRWTQKKIEMRRVESLR